MEQGSGSVPRINRREVLRRGALASGVAWAAPVILTFRTRAFAQSPCEVDCTYVVHFDEEPLICTECQQLCGYLPCGDCPGPACDRITSVTRRRGLRFCTDCVLSQCVMDTVCGCPEDGRCECLMAWNIDPSDPRCGLTGSGYEDSCENAAWEVHFACAP
jgi:hypothetical protein